MRELRNILHLNCVTVTGETIGERLAAWNTWVDRTRIRSIDDPILPDGGLTILFGSLAPGGAVMKRSAADPRLFEREARCIVFASLDDLASELTTPIWMCARRLFSPHESCVGKCHGDGRGGYLPIQKKLARAGVKDMVRISNARMTALPLAQWCYTWRRTSPPVGRWPCSNGGPDSPRCPRRRLDLLVERMNSVVDDRVGVGNKFSGIPRPRVQLAV